jgi:3-oxoadipate enol-lactonase
MPYISINNLRLHYQTAGNPASPPLLIISGISDTLYKCEWQVPELAKDFFIVYFDNRSAGLSDHPPANYGIVEMADDASALLRSLDIATAHVFGFSMGGMIALNLVLRNPDQIDRLILGCTTAGGRLATTPEPDVIAALTHPVTCGDRYQDFLNGMEISLSSGFITRQAETIKRLAEMAAANPQSAQAYLSQLQAVLSHDVADRLDEIRKPVLVLHGDADRLIPPENGRALADHIPGAKLILYEGAGHMFFIEQAAKVNGDIREFLADNTSTTVKTAIS